MKGKILICVMMLVMIGLFSGCTEEDTKEKDIVDYISVIKYSSCDDKYMIEHIVKQNSVVDTFYSANPSFMIDLYNIDSNPIIMEESCTRDYGFTNSVTKTSAYYFTINRVVTITIDDGNLINISIGVS